MHQPTSLWCVLAVLLAAASCCLAETVTPSATISNTTKVPLKMPSTPTPPGPIAQEMPPLIFPKDQAKAPNDILNQRRLNQTQIVIVSNNASENESVAKGPEYLSPEADRSAVPVDSNPLQSNHYETHQQSPVLPTSKPSPPPVAIPKVTGPPTMTSEPSHEARVQKPPSSSLGGMPFLEPSKSAAILAGILASIALLGYVGLFLWRRFLERRYGNREMLVNDDDCYDASDPKNFEL